MDIFYSYIQHFNHSQANVFIKFIIISEHISFIPNKIQNICQVLQIGSPTKEKCNHIATRHIKKYELPMENKDILSRLHLLKKTHTIQSKRIEI